MRIASARTTRQSETQPVRLAYANSGDIKKVAGKAYIITPDSVPLSGDVLEDIESMSEGYFD